MITVIGVRFRHAGRIHHFNPGALKLQKGDYVVLGDIPGRGIRPGCDGSPAGPGGGDRAAAADGAAQGNGQGYGDRHKKNLAQEKEAFALCQQKIKDHKLDMNLVDVEYTFDGSKILFYFTADGRVDFRELVKDLASAFRTRIELRQIGVRDETKMNCGIGICGRPFCCASFLTDFAPVSIKMAKDQNLSLNPTKISGTCGRLMCCLKYEEATYEELNKKLPSEGDTVETKDGTGEVLHVNVLRQLIKVGIKQEKGDVCINEYHLDDIRILQRKRGRKQNQEAMDKEEEKQLKELEKEK